MFINAFLLMTIVFARGNSGVTLLPHPTKKVSNETVKVLVISLGGQHVAVEQRNI